MKSILLAISFLFVTIYADEIQRVESMLSDIAKLRLSYANSQEELALISLKLEDEKEKNKILKKELEKSENEIKNLKNQINNTKISKKQNSVEKVIIKEKVEVCSKNQIKKDNQFPALQMRDIDRKQIDIERTPQTYRLKRDAAIYTAINGDKIEEWEEQSSFTSNYRSNNWIKITGYFRDRVWHKAQRELWIKAQDVKQR